ncbi:NAD(P)-binding protein [Basidiobolus meristosporus CBS 931.73]|uniref:NAD(P)-binding protein n=1 Tax=Basidiobolus meristosporus CBS 931.73 TaxID=1314790 RepID=A0A1Y1YJ65_9FUNG|nr:NAD(P)-binding protein [Basidiobolus meristosporus CBS 931.73]|eukprot:ORX97644.1 NAD(P)-binding protein [Basidiobolus meristosporus CBS 931.73]
MHITQHSTEYPSEPITLTLLGAGNRGNIYASYALKYPQWLKVVAVAEPVAVRRESFAKLHNIPPENAVADWRELLKRPKVSDVVAICLLDHLHREAGVEFANLKYHVLLEKPMATSMPDCVAITEAAIRNQIYFTCGFVLRFSSLNQAAKRIIESGEIGKVLSIQHYGPIGFWHFAHSYVRGKWNKEASSSFTLLTKFSHDVDLITWLVGFPCKKISSFGSLSQFNKQSKPKEAKDAKNCLSCPYADKCPYDAKRMYLDPVVEQGHRGWPANAITDVPDIENVIQALEVGPYGRCVYECDNDVVDQQVVNMEFSNGATATLTMIATGERERRTRIFGTLGQIEIDGEGDKIWLNNFLTREQRIIQPQNNGIDEMKHAGHGGGNHGLVKGFLKAIRNYPSPDIPDAQSSFDSHVYVFAAEHARRTNTAVDIKSFKAMHHYYSS